MPLLSRKLVLALRWIEGEEIPEQAVRGKAIDDLIYRGLAKISIEGEKNLVVLTPEGQKALAEARRP